MKRIKYLFKKAFSWNYKDAYKQAKIIHKKRGGTTLGIFLDMIWCGIKYGAGYCDYVEFEWDLLNASQRKTYLTTELNTRIVSRYNDKAYRHLFSNKVEFNKIFKDYLGRGFLSIQDNEASLEEFEKFCLKQKKICVKPIDASCGEGIEFINVDKKTNFKELYNRLRNEKKYLIEEYVRQHKDLNKLYPGSVNTLRVISFLGDDNEVHIIRAVMKFGTTGETDNHVSGGMYTFLDDNGIVLYPACDDFGNAYDKHPVTGVDIVGFKVPMYEEAMELVRKAGKVVPQVRYVGWDVAISEKGPIIIEGNEFCGLFQNKASTNPSKQGDLPLFRKYIKF